MSISTWAQSFIHSPTVNLPDGAEARATVESRNSPDRDHGAMGAILI